MQYQYLVKSYEDAIKIGGCNRIMAEAIEMVRNFLNDPVVINAMTNEEIEHEQELEDTRELSKIEEKKKTAKNMIEKGYTLEEIRDITGLCEEDINNLV